MGKTFKKLPLKKENLEKQVSILKQKYENRKEQVRRLKAYIKELEKKLEDQGKPVKESKLDKPKKLTPEEKKELAKQELKRQLKEKFGGKKDG